MLRPSEHAEEPPESHLKAVLRVLRRELGNRRLFADNKLDLRDKIDHQLAVRTYRLPQGVSPVVNLLIALAKDLPDQILESLRQRRVGDVPLVLVELASGKETTGWDQHLVQLVDDRRLADAGIAGNQHEFRRAVHDDPLEGGNEHVDLAFPSVELLRNPQSTRCVVCTQGERFDVAVRLPGCQPPPKISLKAGGGLVTLLGGLGEELYDDGRDRIRDSVHPLTRRRRLPGDVAMDTLHWVRGREREHP